MIIWFVIRAYWGVFRRRLHRVCWTVPAELGFALQWWGASWFGRTTDAYVSQLSRAVYRFGRRLAEASLRRGERGV